MGREAHVFVLLLRTTRTAREASSLICPLHPPGQSLLVPSSGRAWGIQGAWSSLGCVTQMASVPAELVSFQFYVFSGILLAF